MVWRNIGLIQYKCKDVNSFTSDAGIRIRRAIYPVVRTALKLNLGGRITIENYPKLEKGTPYIFAATHGFVDEVQLILSVLDRNAYSLMGTTEQLEHNPMIYANWLTGIIYVNRFSRESRSSAVPKMKRILESGSSVLIFPEGGWNNTENLPVMQLFSSPWLTAKETGCKIVPLSCFYEYGTKDYYVTFDEPVDVSEMEKDEALSVLRDKMATLWWNLVEKYSTPLKRRELGDDYKTDYFRERCDEYLQLKWTKDVFDEELTQYFDKRHPVPKQIRASFDDVVITHRNASIFSDILIRREEDKKYDFTKYMHENWNQTIG